MANLTFLSLEGSLSGQMLHFNRCVRHVVSEDEAQVTINPIEKGREQTKEHLLVQIQHIDLGGATYNLKMPNPEARHYSQAQQFIDRWKITKYGRDCPIGRKLGWQPFLICAEGNKGLLTVKPQEGETLDISNLSLSLEAGDKNSIKEASLWFIRRSERRTYTIRNLAFGILLVRNQYSTSLRPDRLSCVWELDENEKRVSFLWKAVGRKSLSIQFSKEGVLLHDKERPCYDSMDEGLIPKQSPIWKHRECTVEGYDLHIGSYPDIRPSHQMPEWVLPVGSSSQGIPTQELAREIFYLNEDNRILQGEKDKQKRKATELENRLDELEDVIAEILANRSRASSSNDRGAKKQKRH